MCLTRLPWRRRKFWQNNKSWLLSFKLVTSSIGTISLFSEPLNESKRGSVFLLHVSQSPSWFYPHLLLLTSSSLLLSLYLLPFLPPCPQLSYLLSSLAEQLSLTVFDVFLLSLATTPMLRAAAGTSLSLCLSYNLALMKDPLLTPSTRVGDPHREWSQSYVNAQLKGNPFTTATPPFVKHIVLRWIPASVVSVS